MSDIYRVVTPENIELNYEVAGIGSRFIALAMDSFIQIIFCIGVYYALRWTGVTEAVINQEFHQLSSSMQVAALILAGAFVWLGYFIILETVLNGQTIGKKLINIRVRKEQGYPPNFWDILLRNIIRPVDFLPSFYGIGFIVMFLNTKAKRLGDYAAGTIVVKEISRRQIRKFLDIPLEIVDNSEKSTVTLSNYPWLKSLLSGITERDYQLLKHLDRRCRELENYDILGLNLLGSIIIKIYPEDPPIINTKDVAVIIKELIRLYESTRLL